MGKIFPISPGYMNIGEAIKVKPYGKQGAISMHSKIHVLHLQLFSRPSSGLPSVNLLSQRKEREVSH